MILAIFVRWATRLYWGLCGVVMLIGLAGLVAVIEFPPEEFDAEGRLIGEMPPAFAVALAFIALGLSGALFGFAAKMAAWVWRRRPYRWRRRQPQE